MTVRRNKTKKAIAKVERIVTRAISKTMDWEKQYYANLTKNISENLHNYMDGTAAHIQKVAEKRAKDNAKTANIPLLPCTTIFDMDLYHTQTTFTCTKCSRMFHGRDSLHIHIVECAEDSDKENVSPKYAKKGRKVSKISRDCVKATVRRGIQRTFGSGLEQNCKIGKKLTRKAQNSCKRLKRARKIV